MRSGGDLYGRSQVGPVFYAIGCIVTAWMSGYLSPLRKMGWMPAALFVAMFFLRRINRPSADFSDARAFARWRIRHWALIHGGCLLWGLVALYFASAARASWLPLSTTLVISVMLGSALSQAFAMEKRQTAITLLLLYGPATLFFATVPNLRPNAVIIVTYLAYQFSSVARLAREYESQLQTEYALLLSRAQIEQLTRIDALTGLANRREYEIVYPKVWSQAGRQESNLAMLVFDIDHFKAVNDGHGHLAGDACLQHFAKLLREQFRRDVDLLARIGGEEFVAVLPGASTEEAAKMAERFRARLEQTPCLWKGEPLSFTVSIGVGSAAMGSDAKPETTFARVDAACYEAKISGRNRVILSSPA